MKWTTQQTWIGRDSEAKNRRLSLVFVPRIFHHSSDFELRERQVPAAVLVLEDV
jgi:hypothetical protein